MKKTMLTMAIGVVVGALLSVPVMALAVADNKMDDKTAAVCNNVLALPQEQQDQVLVKILENAPAANVDADPAWANTNLETMKAKGWTKHGGAISNCCWTLGEFIGKSIAQMPEPAKSQLMAVGGKVVGMFLDKIADQSVLSKAINDENRHWVACSVNIACPGLGW